MILLSAGVVFFLVLVIGTPPEASRRIRRLTASSGPENGKATRRPRAAARKKPRGRREEVDVAVLLDLLAAALAVGSPIPQALSAVGGAVSGQRGDALRRISAQLALGADWEQAWNTASPGSSLQMVKSSLAPAWMSGAPVAPILEHAKKRVRAQRSARDREAAKKLSVRLIIPVAVCYLPAFVVLGLIPVLLALIGQQTTLL